MSNASEIVQIEGQSAKAISPEGTTATLSVSALFDAAFPHRIDTGGLILPEGTLQVSSSGPWTVLAHQTPPLIYLFRWIEDRSRVRFGPGTRYAQVRIALPYLIILAVFRNGVLGHLNECFFRTEPITSESDPLFYPALLNCSRFVPQEGKPLSWICTQKLEVQAFASLSLNQQIRGGFQALRHCLIETGFNESSEHHEGSSWYTESRKIDRRIGSIQAWEKATEDAPLFVLDLPWIPTGLSLGQVIERIFRNQGAVARSVSSAGDMARIIFNHAL